MRLPIGNYGNSFSFWDYCRESAFALLQVKERHFVRTEIAEAAGDKPSLRLRCRAGGYQPPLTLAKPLPDTQVGLGGAARNNDDSCTYTEFLLFGKDFHFL